MISAIIIGPAYGRKYNTKEKVIEDWDNNRDFVMIDGMYRYISKHDYTKYGNRLDKVFYLDGNLAVELA